MRFLNSGLISTALLLAGTPQLQAGPEAMIVSASDLNTACMKDAGNSATCSVYIAGFSRGLYYATVSAQAGYPSCTPPNLSDGEARSIVTSFMQSHSEMMQQRAPSVIAEALINAFPCGANHKAGATTP
jgi:hypothetical protein